MAVILTADSRIYWNYQVHELPEGTVVTDPEFSAYLLSTGSPDVKPVEDEPAQEQPAEPKRRTRRAGA